MSNLVPLLLSLSIVIASCSPKVTTQVSKSYEPLPYQEPVVVLSSEQETPPEAELLGQLKVGDTGFSTKCDYQEVIAAAQTATRKAGGNVVKITEHKMPGLASSCHRIKANILRVANTDELLAVASEEEITPGVDYAILHVYRYSGVGPLVGYNRYLGDSLLCRVKNNFKTTLHLHSTGRHTLWAKTEAKSEVPVNLEPGHHYYLKCAVKMGALVGRPTLELVDDRSGKGSFESFNAKRQ